MKILVIGDAMQDEYWQGYARRLSPVAPVPVISVQRTESRPGAAANVAANLEAMGAQVERIYGAGERIRKITVTDKRQHIARLDFDYQQQHIQPDAAFLEAVGRCGLVVALDYGKGSLTGIQALIRATGKPVLIDPKGHDYAKYRGAALIKPNRDEMRELVGGWASREELDFKARQFLAASDIESLLLTQAAEGMTLYTRTETLHEPATNASPEDVSGAGEAALAAYAASLVKGYALKNCLRFASKAAGIAISRQGTTVVSAEELWN